MQRSTQMPGCTLLIELGCYGRGSGVEGEYGAELGVNSVDTSEIELHEPRGGPLAAIKAGG